MTQNLRQLSIGRAVGVSILFALAASPGYLRLAVGPLLGAETGPLMLAGVWCWILLLLATAGGLAAGRRWGAYLLVPLVLVSTVALSVPLVPMVTSLVPGAYRPHALFVVNMLVLLTAPLLLRRAPASDAARGPELLATR